MYVPQSKTDHQISEILFINFRWIGHYNVEKASPNIKSLTRKTGTAENQDMCRMLLRQFTHTEPIPDVQTMSHERKFDPRSP